MSETNIENTSNKSQGANKPAAQQINKSQGANKPAAHKQINELIKKIIKNNQNVIQDINKMLIKLVDIFNEKTEKYMVIMHEKIKLFNDTLAKLDQYLLSDSDRKVNINDYFLLIDYIEKCTLILQQMHSILNKLLNKTKNSESFLSQTFINETFTLHKNITLIYQRINKVEENDKDELVLLIVKLELNNPELIAKPFEYSKKIQQLFRAHSCSIDLFSELMFNIIKMIPTWHPDNRQLIFSILTIIEDEKTRILNLNTSSNKITIAKTKMLNPYYKNFGLIPVSKLLPISDISQKIFNIPVNTLNEFVKICKDKDYGLIIIKKHIAHPITYNTNQLLDWKESQEFEKHHKADYGVDADLLVRYKTIAKIDTKTKWDFSIETHVFKFDNYENDREKFIIVLDSLAPEQYRITVNFMSTNKYFIRVSSIRELYMHCTNNQQYVPTRIGKYNALCINNALPFIFSPIKINFDNLKVVASIVDPKYLGNQIYLLMLDAFKQTANKKYQGGKKIRDNYTYALIIHDNEFLNIFSNVLINEFHSYLYKNYDEYLTGHIQISEITASFLNVIYIYQRTFVKEVHDYFKENLFDFNVEGDVSFKIIAHFDGMIHSVLKKIITADSNIYQAIIYKINLLKITLV